MAMNDAGDLVARAAFEAELARVGAEAAGAREGMCGPQSMRWRIDREAALFLGAGRALLLQLAHPWVAAAVAAHSRALDDPIGRFHGTFATMFAMVFGSLAEAQASARQLHRRHAGITGTLADGGRYAANDRAALAWVQATLIDTAVMVYGLVLPLSADERVRYYAESLRLGGLFGLSPGSLPDDWPAFSAYNEAMWQSPTLAVSDDNRAIAHRLLAGAGSRIFVPAWYRALTAALLPPRLRVAFALPYGAAERHAADRALGRLRLLYPLLPPRLRFVAPYFEARERIAGCDRPRALTRLGNRFWIGRPSLAAASPAPPRGLLWSR
jgi:uncharacterized protein (DUF2236 family)